ncbi:Vegetative incompatibility protein HET-E-1 [Colletotrichum scovillei]|nr:Vegetative incompatibility protein HET-E-1 [Colletotrichum scovillei]
MDPINRIHESGRQSPVRELNLHETTTDLALGVTPYATNTNTTPPFNQCVPNLDRAPEFEVKWESGDAQDPRSWPTWYKAFTVTTVSLGATVVSLFSTLYTSGIPGLQAEFHVSKLVALLGLTTYLFGMAAGSLIVAPMSESLGRRPLYIACMAAFLVLVLPSALAESITTIIATRFFGGFFGSTMMSNSPATVNDIISDKHRALALGFWSIGPANGPVYGPLIGGFVYQYMGWRWTNWIVLIVGGVVFVLLASVKETYAPVLLRRQATEKCRITGDDRWWTRYDHGQGFWPLLKINLYRPLKMMCTEPICMFWNTYIGIVYATLYLCFVAYPIAFQQERGWAPGIGGLAFLGIGCGTLIPIAAEPLLRRIVNLHQKDPATGNVKPEARVSVVCIGAVLLAVGQLWFAWTCRPGTHWIVPIIAGVPYGAGNACTFIYANNYMAQSYGVYAASALAGNMVAVHRSRDRLGHLFGELDTNERLKNISGDSGSLGSPEITPETLKTPDQLKRFVDAGLEESEKIAAVKKNIEKFNQIFLPVKEVMSVVVLAAPQAAIPWSCVSFSLQILANPLTESSINREGITYVLSTMDWYCNLFKLLIDGEDRSKKLKDELKKQIVELYKRLLLYQMKSVYRYYRSQILVLLGDVFKIDDWTGELTGVKEAEDQVRARLGQYQNSSICDSLKTLAGAMQHQTNQIQDLSSLIQKQNQAQQDREKQQDRENCLIDFRQKVDPHHEKDRIQIEKGGLLRDAYSWVLDHDNYRRWHKETRHNILWIKGDPGKGETMLLCGIIDELEMDPTHTLSYFFCQATETTLNSATAVLRGLIYGLAKRYPQVDRYIYDKYKDGGGKAAFEGDSAWGVMCGILNAILGDPIMNGVLLIVDALDECVEGRQKLLDFICERSNNSRAKWIVSSRNWPEIETNLERITERTSALSLELNSDLVAHAVRTYIRRRVDKLAEKQPYHGDLELRSHVEEYLNKNSSDTFLWVALVCDALRQDNILRRAHVIGPKGVLQTFPKGLDKLYKRMFQYISGAMDADLCKDVLAVIAILERSVTSLELCSIMGLSQHFDGKVETLQDAVRCCGSFLSLRGGTIYFVHQSAQDFLLNKEGDAFDSIFPDGVEDIHWAVCLRSMDAISKIVRREIYELQDVGVARNDTTVLNPDPLASVAYSCAYWMKHLEESNPATYIKDDGVVDEFLQSKFLYWLEALALLGELTHAVRGIQKLQHVISSLNNKSLADLVHDADRFLLYHNEMIAEFPLQIYETALLFSPEESVVRKLFFEDHAPEWISIMPGLDMTWDAHLQSLPGHESSINTAVYSPDGQWILSTSEAGTVKLWQADSVNFELRYGGFGEGLLHPWSKTIKKAGVGSAVFSEDSHTFTAASWNGVIKVWNLKTNQVEIFRGHEEVTMATTMAISPDGRTFAYGLENRVIHIWNMDKKTSTRISMASITGVQSLSFTTDGRWLASVGEHDVIRIWNSSTGECKKEIRCQGGWKVKISGDGQWIAVGNLYRDVRVWGMKSGRLIHNFERDSNTATRDISHISGL